MTESLTESLQNKVENEPKKTPKVLILVAGWATRLGELTADGFPKALLSPTSENPKDGDAPTILDLLINQLYRANIPPRDIVIYTNEAAKPYFQKFIRSNTRYSGIEILTNGITLETKDDRPGAIPDIKDGVEQAGWNNDNVFVVAGDTVTDLDVTEMLQKFHNYRTYDPSVLGLNVVRDLGKNGKQVIANALGCVVIDESGKMLSFTEKPPAPESTLTSVPFYLFTPAIIALLASFLDYVEKLDASQAKKLLDSPGAWIPWLLNSLSSDQSIVTHPVGTYDDLGTVEQLKKYRQEEKRELFHSMIQ